MEGYWPGSCGGAGLADECPWKVRKWVLFEEGLKRSTDIGKKKGFKELRRERGLANMGLIGKDDAKRSDLRRAR